MMQESLARKLRVLRAERGITLQEAEELTGVTRETIAALEHGQRGAYTNTLQKLATGYDVTVSELLEEPALALGKDEAPTETGLSSWAETTDVSVFATFLNSLTDEELKDIAEELGSVEVKTREDLPLSREEGIERAVHLARMIAMHDVLVAKRIPLPPSFKLAHSRHFGPLEVANEEAATVRHDEAEAG